MRLHGDLADAEFAADLHGAGRTLAHSHDDNTYSARYVRLLFLGDASDMNCDHVRNAHRRNGKVP
jgi:hypothetical protein